VRRETHTWSNALLLLATLALVSVGCGDQPTQTPNLPTATAPPIIAEVKPTGTATPPAIRVLQVMPVSQVTRNDEYYFDNCSPDIPATRPLSEAAQVQMSVTIADQATQLAGSATAPIPADVKDRLAAEVKVAYQQALDAARAKVSQTTLFINAHDRYNIVIVWEERVYSGTVSFPMDGVAYTTEYTYTLEVPRAGSIKPGICTP
jgi:hypothetical protein